MRITGLEIHVRLSAPLLPLTLTCQCKRRLGHAPILPGYEAPDGCMIGAPRSGPLFSGLRWISLATFYNASIAINGALLAREITGSGQHVHTSMLQGVLATTVGVWQRVEHADRPAVHRRDNRDTYDHRRRGRHERRPQY